MAGTQSKLKSHIQVRRLRTLGTTVFLDPDSKDGSGELSSHYLVVADRDAQSMND
jgi:hypothetical protein